MENQKNPLIEAAAAYISKSKNSFSSGYIAEAKTPPKEDPKITAKVHDETGDIDAYHVGATKEGHHVYAHSETDRGESSSYTVAHPDGKMTRHVVDHGGELPKMKDLKKPSEHHNVDKLHPSVQRLIHKDLKDNHGEYDYDD